MSVSTSSPGLADSATNSSCVFLDNNASLKKSKRKRTSPQDQAVLDAAYLTNSKPDKGERATIVSQVDLNEKEVQIWFQNRRQNERRRSKPLQPSELEAHIHNRSTSPTTPVLHESVAQTCSAPTPSPITDKSPISSPGKSTLLSCSADEVPHPAFQNGEPINTPPSSVDVDKIQVTSTSGSGRKRVHDEMVESDRVAVGSLAMPPKIKEPLKRSSSMRLAMTADGAVKIKTSDSPTPSPPKARPAPLGDSNKKAKLSRSTSMFEDGQTFRDLSKSKKLARVNSNFGRSRDARTWEFYCDSGPDHTLTAHAEAERKGSAVSAINLIRSAGSKARGSAALSPIPTKGNLRVAAQSVRGEKKKLVRAQSSLGRLQAGSSRGNPNPRRVPRPCGGLEGEDENDEKENWKPGTTLLVHELRRTGPSTNTRPTLGRNAELSLPPSSESPTKVAADLDCVQGLLSLSQGAWK